MYCEFPNLAFAISHCFLHALGFKKNRNFHTGLVSDTIGYRMLCIQLTCLSDTRVQAYYPKNPFFATNFLKNQFCREVECDLSMFTELI